MKVCGQDYHFSGIPETRVYTNPAYAAIPASGEVGLTYRNQWPGIPATFVTYGASLVMPLPRLTSGVGLTVTNDMQAGGVINQSAVTLLYAYRIQAGDNWHVSAGIGASYVFHRFSASTLVFRADILNELGYGFTPVTLENYSRNFPDFSVGIMARNREDFTLGLSAAHITRPQYSLSPQSHSRFPIRMSVFVSRKIILAGNDGATAEPAIYFSKQQANHELVWGSRFWLAGHFMLGGFIRQNLQFRTDALILAAGISWDQYNISYHYDVNLKKFNFLSTKLAAHEVTFLYRFEYNDEHYRNRKRGSVDCPAYN
jgi:type IX secretion system PorP/SprF family membrane protein